MVEEFIELMNLGVIRFPYEYGGNDFIRIKSGVDKLTGDEIFTPYEISDDERISLTNIDLMKSEITNIHRFSNQENTSVTYALSKEKERKMHDDRFYSIIMLAHRLYEIRRGAKTKADVKKPTSPTMFSFKTPQIR